jgi:hypothetical protein
MVDRAPYTGRPAIQDMRVDLRRRDVAVPEQFLNGTDVVPVLEQVRREGMTRSIRILLMNRPRYGFRTATIPSSAPRFR